MSPTSNMYRITTKCCSPQGACPLGERNNHGFSLYILDVIPMHMLDAILINILDVLIRMQILNVLLLLLATTVIAPLFWKLLRCNNGA